MKLGIKVFLVFCIFGLREASFVLPPPNRRLYDHDDISAMTDSADNGKLNSDHRKSYHEGSESGEPRSTLEKEVG